eukprot:8922896-Prorocentrum_lima.AAC.1
MDQADKQETYPAPPYTTDTAALIQHGIMCYYPGCGKRAKSYGQMFTHVRSWFDTLDCGVHVFVATLVKYVHCVGPVCT